MKSYVPTNYRLKEGEPLIALGSHQADLNFCIRRRWVVPNGLVTFYTHAQ